jgi:peptidyl-prolyl cis-trans isomerase C
MNLKLPIKAYLVGLGFALPLIAADVAKVNDRKMTADQLKAALDTLGPNSPIVRANPDMMERFLNHLIDNQLLAERARARKIDQSKEFQSRMEQARDQILAELFIDRYISENTSEAALHQHFEENKDKFAKKEIKASHILMKDEKESSVVLKKALSKGANFAELARKYSTGPSAPKGGDLGWFSPGRMVPEFEKAANATPKGEVHPLLVKTQFGFHIIKVDDIKEPRDIRFDSVREEVKSQLTRKLQEQLKDEIRQQAKIEIYPEAIRQLKL